MELIMIILCLTVLGVLLHWNWMTFTILAIVFAVIYVVME